MSEVTVMNGLCATERETLAECEAAIERGRRAACELWLAVKRIHDGRLYRLEYDTFEDYMERRWGYSRSQGYQFIKAAEKQSAIADKRPDLPLPENEAQIRPMTREDDDTAIEAWSLVVEHVPAEERTAAHVAAAVEAVKQTDDEAERVAALFGRSPSATPKEPEAKKEPRNHDMWFTRPDHRLRVVATLGSIELDPASCEEANAIIQAERYFTKEQDGLLQHWEAATLFLNPPYSLASDFVGRLVDAYQEGHIGAAILLVNANTSSAWFEPLWDYPICFVKGRVSFIAGDGGESQTGWSPSVFVYLGPDPLRFYENFHDLGAIVSRMEKPIW